MNTILVVRAFDDFSRILAAEGFEIINLPLITTEAIADLRQFEAQLENIENYDGIFLTSANATEIFRAKLFEKNMIYPGKVYILGKRSREILRMAKLDLRFDETINTAREMLENIAPEAINGKRFLFVRGTKSLRIVPELLAKTAAVDEAIVYETRNITIETDKINRLREKFKTGEIAAACFFSTSAAESFIEQFGAENLHQTKITTIGKTTAEYFTKRNLKVGFVSSKTAAKDFAVELIEYLRKGLPAKFTEETKKREI